MHSDSWGVVKGRGGRECPSFQPQGNTEPVFISWCKSAAMAAHTHQGFFSGINRKEVPDTERERAFG